MRAELGGADILRRVLLPDHHVHTEWSWDAGRGSMRDTCVRALEIGLPSIAFTDHADFTDYVRARDGLLDIAGYHQCIERCRAAFPTLRILSGIELGEPHRFPEEVAALRSAGPLDRVLGSVHCFDRAGELVDASTPGLQDEMGPDAVMRSSLGETLDLLRSQAEFDVLAHIDYAKRYRPQGSRLDPFAFEEELRAVLREAARRGVALEINTTRGGDRDRYLCPDLTVLTWWREEGGRALAFGSDAHSPDRVAAGFELAAEVAEAAGFRPQDDPSAFWRT